MEPKLPRQFCYRYQPLQPDEIRVLRLRPGPKSWPIICSLTPVSLNDKPDYQALSYEWGNKEDTSGILVVDGLPHRRLMQTNLELALREIRSETEDMMLWVDAICINQDDNDEKSHRVAKMGDIYRNAINVISWLGPDRDGSDTAMELMSNREAFVTSAQNRLLSRPQVDAVIALLHRSYWMRVWIIQELQLARSFTVRCGSETIPGDTFQHCVG